MHGLLGRLGNPERSFDAIHVVGTNGKGSTPLYAEALLRAEDVRVGAYLSPHLTSFRERIRIGGAEINPRAYEAAVLRVRDAVGADVTQFEALTAAAFAAFAAAGVRWAVVEAGLGGRLDATNVLARSRVQVLTNISLEHTELLGETREAIAAEKLAVVPAGGVVVVGEAASGREALSLLSSTPADLVLSDIHMPDMDGIELARHLLKLAVPPILIFTTAYHEHAIAAFEVHAVDYLVKPVRVQRLLAALQQVPRLRPLSEGKLDRLPAAARRFLSVTERSRVVLVAIEEVIYLKAELKYITIRTADREFLLEESLTRLEEEFGSRFVRVHRNCLVARDAIRGFERRVSADGDAHWEVLLRGVTGALPVSRRQQFIVREIGRDASR